MKPSEHKAKKENKSQTWPGNVESALARGECKTLDNWITRAGSWFHAPEINKPSSIHHTAASVFSALFFRVPDHPQLAAWAERARDSLDSLPYSSRLTLARRLLRYDIFFGRPERASLLMDTLRAQGIAQFRSATLQVQWGLLLALYQDALGTHSKCVETIQKTVALASQLPDNQWVTTLHALEISSYIGLGDITAAHRAWDKSLAQQPHSGLIGMAYRHRLGSQIALADGNTALALEHSETAQRLTTRAGAPLFHALSCLAATEVHLERDSPEMAETTLRQAEEITQVAGSAQLACLCSFMRAYRTLKSNTSADAENDLRFGFGLASRHGFQNIFGWSPRLMTTLCVKALEHEIEISYVQQLVQTHRITPEPTPVHVEAWPWPVKVYTLGRFAVLINNQPARSGRKAQHKPLELLKALIAQGGREVSEDTLTAMLWPDAEGDTARQAFDTTLHRLRKLLGNDQAIFLHDRKLGLDNRYCWVDSWAFERLMTESETILSNPATDPNGATLAQQVNRIYALYHGSFLGKESGAVWSVSLRERLRSRYFRYIISAGARWQELGRWDLAIECYRKGLEVDDLAEQLYLNLMSCHYEYGQRSEALSVYRRCRFILSVVLGMTPSPETESLYQRLRSMS